MPLYRVEFQGHTTIRFSIEVEAESEDTAQDIAYDEIVYEGKGEWEPVLQANDIECQRVKEIG